MRKNIYESGGIVVVKNDSKFFVLLNDSFSEMGFSKGRVDEGEIVTETAIREVMEDSGIECEIIKELDPMIYFNEKDDVCTVRFFLMRPVSSCDIGDYNFIEVKEVENNLSSDYLKEYFATIKNDIIA